MPHTADPKSQPGLAHACDAVYRLEAGECMTIERHEARSLDIHANPFVGGTPFDRIMGNIIGSARNFSLRINQETGAGVFCRVENPGRKYTYLDPDRRVGGPETTEPKHPDAL